MPEVPVSALSFALQKQVESARAAFDRGKPAQAAEQCAKILAEQPACLNVRKLERAALLKLAATRPSGLSKLVQAVSNAPFLLGGSLKLKEEPRLALAHVEKLLRRDPQNIAALGLLGQAAMALNWPETAVFAYEAASDLDHGRPDLLVALSGAYLAAGRAKDAVHAADEALQLQPANADALALHRTASVAVTMAQGKWEQGGDFRGKLADNSQAAKVANRPSPPQP
jgi:cytochrome c-type biogenesis protein CcmH/NrfG